MTGLELQAKGRRRAILGLGVLLRLVLFFFQDDKHADAPMRALIAVRLNAEPAARLSTAAFCQFGPLPIELMRPFLAVATWLGAGNAEAVTARLLSLVAGLVALPLLARWAEAWVGAEAADLALLAFAVSPLALQLGTTSGSEALYIVLTLAAALALRQWVSTSQRRWLVLGGLAFSLTAVTRFDAWFGLPAAALVLAWTSGSPGRRRWTPSGVLLALAGLLPLAYLAWSARTTGDPFFFARFIRADHEHLGASAVARYGAAGARARQLGLWLVAFLAAATPVMAWSALRLRGRSWLRDDRDQLRPDVATMLAFAWTPIALYVVQGLVTGAFEPLPRFALLPSTLLLPAVARLLLRPAPSRRPWLVVPALAVLFSLGATLLSLTGRHGRLWGGAESLGAWTRLDGEDRALATYLQQHRQRGESVFLDPMAFTDIAIAHAAAIPQRQVATLTHTRTPARTLAATVAQTGARWFAAHDAGWGHEGIPDWPASSLTLGGWHLVHVDGLSSDGHLRTFAVEP